MYQYKRSDLQFNYSWTAKEESDDPNYTKKPNSTLLDRDEGYEMIYFINKVGRRWGWGDNCRPSMLHLERIIKTEVPTSVRSHENIMNWISQHYKEV